MSLKDLRSELNSLANSEKAKVLQGYFKTGKGEYGEGDIFLGISVPDQRKIAKNFYKNLTLKDIQELLKSKIHEERFTGLEALNFMYEKNLRLRKDIFDFYLDNTKYINNWDLVDTSAPYIVGHFLYHFGKEYPIYKMLLRKMAQSSHLWTRRISIISTYYFIKNRDFEETLELARILLDDKHDLIQKAAGWMLREIGNRDMKILEDFLIKNYKKMPRTMLRYSIEKFPKNKRKNYLKGKI